MSAHLQKRQGDRNQGARVSDRHRIPSGRPVRAPLGGFSLLELLVVIAIIGILAALVTPSLSGMSRSYQLGRAAALIEDNLRYARQLAGTRNLPVVVNLCQSADEVSGTDKFNLIQLVLVQPDGSSHAATKPVRLPSGMSISEETAWSSLMSLPLTNTVVQGRTVDCRQIPFSPSGRTTLAASGNWFLTVYPHGVSSSPTNNFVTLVLDPVTARVVSHQPGLP